MVNFSCSALLFPSEPSPVGCAKHREIPSLQNAGLHFSASIGKPSRRWTSSPGQQSLSVRLTLATKLLSNGTRIENVAALLGNSPKIVRKHYAAWVKERQEALDQAVL